VTLAGRDFVEIEVEGDRLRVPAGAFFQPNTHGWTLLRQQVIDLLEPQRSDRILELYCGVGFFTLPVARRASAVVAVEGLRSAVAAVRDNLARSGMVNVQVVGREVASATPGLLRNRSFDAVLIDPPRAGLARRTAELLLRAPVGRLVYVSCDPGTLARDLKILTSRGGFRAGRVVPVDLFPHTHHVECVARLDR
jgi:23S rRNA (uracil1939-C5)-methyltransferase